MPFFAPGPAFACKRALSLCHALTQRLAMPRICAACKAPAVFLALWSNPFAQPWALSPGPFLKGGWPLQQNLEPYRRT